MTGIIICDNCGSIFIGNGNLHKIRGQKNIVNILKLFSIPKWKGIRKITSKKIGSEVVPHFQQDLCDWCTKNKR